ncbi:hypothetical protein EVG20_g3775 [Dentipellis fragilis]|uniref:Protein YIP n=1 Tax=Dentipellis fragilis TaxID=205917 RepID=A0A4Y9YZ45_9AGAM|nr:hypothetical protein EVG20_g3775 [Dentipellis fragilis]
MWQDNSFGSSSSQSSYYPQTVAPNPPLQFYDQGTFYPGSRSSLEGNVGGQGSIVQQGVGNYGGNIQTAGGWWTAFGTGGFEGEPPLLEGLFFTHVAILKVSLAPELGINFPHISTKSMAVLNPLRRIDEHIMDDADLAGPLLFCFCFGTFLLFSGKPQFGYIYGVGLLGSASIYTLLNLMSENGIDAYRTVSVLGYCLLPMVGVGAVSVLVTLDGLLGYVLSLLSIAWCTYAASTIFVAVLRMHEQRFVFNVGASGSVVGK